MSNVLWLRDLNIAECAFCFGVLGIMLYKHQLRAFGALMGLLAVRALTGSILIPLLFFRKATGLSIETAYDIYFFTNWISAGLQAILLVATIYDVYRKAMRPLQGLQRIGKVIFRWVAVVSIAVSIAIAAGPHLGTASFAGSIATTGKPDSTGHICPDTLSASVCVLCNSSARAHLQQPDFWRDAGTRPDGNRIPGSGRMDLDDGCRVTVFPDLPRKHGRLARFSLRLGSLLCPAGARAQDDPAADDVAVLHLESHLGGTGG